MKAAWVWVPGPNGPTTVHLSPEWLAALKKRAGARWTADYTTALVKMSAQQVLRGYDALRDGAFSQCVRRRAYEMAL